VSWLCGNAPDIAVDPVTPGTEGNHPQACAMVALGSVQAQTTTCDRACLEDMMSAYLSAWRLTSREGWREVSENDQALALGSGKWQVAGPPGKHRHVFADPQAGEVAAITTIPEHGVAAIYTVRLKVVGGNLSEIERRISRDALYPFKSLHRWYWNR
jgi:hypothetical protein